MKRRRWDVLCDLALRYRWTAGAEIGVLRGDTFFRLLSRCPALTMIGVDLWQPQPDKEALRPAGGRSYLDHDLATYERLVRGEAGKYGARARLITARSLDAARQVADGSLDFVFLDADHTEAAVRADIAAWRPKLRPGGMMTGHDYNRGTFPGVCRAVDDLLPGRMLHDDHVWSCAA